VGRGDDHGVGPQLGQPVDLQAARVDGHAAGLETGPGHGRRVVGQARVLVGDAGGAAAA
jgi:hypothetical protein